MRHNIVPRQRVLVWVFCALMLNLAVGLSLKTAQSAPASVITVCDEAHLTTALSGGGAVTFNCNSTNDPATIMLSSQKVLVSGTTIDGGGVITISGNYSMTLFSLSSGRTATFANLRLSGAGGSNGMVIFNDGTVNVTNTQFISNAAPVLFNRTGSAVFTNSIISDTNSFSVIVSDATLTMNNTTIMGNSGGGGVFVRGGTTTLNNSTMSGNGGGILVDSVLLLNNSTVVSNSSNIYDRSGLTTAKNSIIAHNGGGNCLGTFASAGYNIASTGNCGLTQTTDFSNTDPLLGPLTDNGGPTFTHLPLFGSRAIDGGRCDLAADQRGHPRPGNGTIFCDIGAVEVPTVTVDVEISTSVTPSVAAPYMPITYMIVFSNTGSGRAAGVAITNALPAFLTGASTSSSGASITATDGITYEWQLSSLPGASSGRLTVTGFVRGDASAGVYTSTAIITSSNELTPTNDSANATVTIQTGFQYSAAYYTVTETAGAALVTITLSIPSAVTTTVDYATGGGTAVAGTDYTATNGTLIFPPFTSSQTFTVPIINIIPAHTDQNVLLSLSNPSGALLSMPNPATLIILNVPPVSTLYLPAILR